MAKNKSKKNATKNQPPQAVVVVESRDMPATQDIERTPGKPKETPAPDRQKFRIYCEACTGIAGYYTEGDPEPTDPFPCAACEKPQTFKRKNLIAL